MNIDYSNIANVAITILESAMSEKTGDELQSIFDLGEEAFDKIHAAAMIAAAMVERIVNDSIRDIEDISEFDTLVGTGIRQLEE